MRGHGCAYPAYRSKRRRRRPRGRRQSRLVGPTRSRRRAIRACCWGRKGRLGNKNAKAEPRALLSAVTQVTSLPSTTGDALLRELREIRMPKVSYASWRVKGTPLCNGKVTFLRSSAERRVGSGSQSLCTPCMTHRCLFLRARSQLIEAASAPLLLHLHLVRGPRLRQLHLQARAQLGCCRRQWRYQ